MAPTKRVIARRDQVDFIYTSNASRPIPAGTARPYPEQSVASRARPARATAIRPRARCSRAPPGVSDILLLGPGISLCDLTFQRLNGNADLRITYDQVSSTT